MDGGPTEAYELLKGKYGLVGLDESKKQFVDMAKFSTFADLDKLRPHIPWLTVTKDAEPGLLIESTEYLENLPVFGFTSSIY